jgi:hypothetical protein
MKFHNRETKEHRERRIKNMKENEMFAELLAMGWEMKDLGLITRRIIFLARQGEIAEDIAFRLNPKRELNRPVVPQQWLDRERAYRESPALDLELSSRVRDARNRQRI